MLPTGTVTFLFSDVEGSTRLWEVHPQEMQVAIARHDVIMQTAIAEKNGHVVKQRGDGFHAAFASAYDAVNAAVAAQTALQEEPWDEVIGAIRVRISLHTSTAQLREGDYYGPQVNRAARLESIAHGGQVLISSATRELIRDELPEDVGVIDLDRQRLKDLSRPERVYQLVAADIQSDFPPLRSLDSRHNNLPILQTSFLGRETELNEICELFGEPNCRLLTLVGPGGIGKTRLVLTTAAESIDEFSHGVWLVELAAITEAEILPDQIASVFGVTAQEARGGRGVTDVLVDYFKDKTLLLVLDNCEHLIEACASFAEVMLQRCPKVKLLATSREDFGIPGEWTYRVSPLALPPDETPLPDLEMYPAIQLFLERARVARPRFGLTEDNGAVLAEICRTLDGIPLAIELAAARVRVISLEQISERLQDRFYLLAGGPRTALPRHQTLQATMDWSYNLLSEPERALLRRLSVFTGGWTLEAAEEVASFGEVTRQQVLDLLTLLVDKSLVGVEERGNIMRYGMLETVRQYGVNKLSEQGEVEETQRRYATFFIQLAEGADEGLRDARQLDSLELLDTEHDNIRSALGWSLDSREMDLAFRLVGAMGWFWFMRGHWVDARRWLTKVLDLGAGGSPPLRAKAICRAGGLELIRGNLIGTVELVEGALDIFRRESDDSGIAWCLNLLGQARTFRQEDIENANADPFLIRSAEIFSTLEDDWGVSWSNRYLGQVAEFRGDLNQSYELQKQALHGFEVVGDIWNVAHSFFLLGASASRHRDLEVAKWAFEESLEKCGMVEDKVMEAHALKGLAHLALYRNDLIQAEELFQVALEALQKIGDEGCVAGANKDLAEVMRRQGDFLQAKELLSQSLHSFENLGFEENIVWVVERFAALAHSMGNGERAARLLAVSDTYLGEGVFPLSPTFRDEHKQLVTSTRKLLGDQVYERLYAEGAAMDLQEAVVYALEEIPEN